MEIRRVQMTGGSSYIITLPKDWVKTVNIGKNDPIGLLQQPDGTLLVTPKMDKEQTKRSIRFKVENGAKQSFLFRKLIGAYIAGFNAITIESKPRIQPKTRSTIRRFIQTTIGQEVVEETDTTITVKDLLNPSEMPFHRTIKRMHIIVKGMYEDTTTALKTHDKNLAEDVIKRDGEIDRLHWLVARQHRIIQQNVNFVEKMGITVDTATTSYLISRILERIGDHVNRIAEYVILLLNNEIDDTIVKKVEYGNGKSLTLLNKSIGAFTKKEIKEANETIELSEELENLCEDIDKLALKQDAAVAISLGYIVESIRRIGEYAEDISETVINHLIGREKI
ncbi:MAG: phosphate uptake regulator PhoU [Candidatus Thermoplasmatota archaeon]|nr:phosphate uptake regulator PhoU [Candidatus Thermoplasmatota archaeon]MBS3801888.1 phosphate uptake regulator PhoU [Candidatus Thermoplasmatota archaeon]